jgi:hypothetical protein
MDMGFGGQINKEEATHMRVSTYKTRNQAWANIRGRMVLCIKANFSTI